MTKKTSDYTDVPTRSSAERQGGFNKKHLVLPGTVIKEVSSYDEANDRSVLDCAIASTEAYLTELRDQYGVSVVPHMFTTGPSFMGEGLALFCVADRVKGGEPLDALVKEDDINGLKGALMISGKILDHVDEVIKNGGALQPEFFRYDQFVSLSSENSDVTGYTVPVLVDVEPFAPLQVRAPQERHAKSDFDIICWSLQICAGQLIELRKHGQGEETMHYLISLIDSLPDENGLKRVKKGMKDCIQRGDYERLEEFLDEEFETFF